MVFFLRINVSPTIVPLKSFSHFIQSMRRNSNITPQNLNGRLKTSATIGELRSHANQHQHMFQPIHDATACVACGRLATANERVLPQCREFFVIAANMWLSRPEKEHGKGARAVSNILHAGAKLGMSPTHEVIQKMFDEALRRIDELEPQHSSNLMWSAAKMGVTDPRVINGLAKACVNHISEYNHQGASNALWAIATLGVCDSGTIKALAYACVDRAKEFNPQHAANSLWAVARLGVTDATIIAALAGACVSCSKDFKTLEAINALWAVATLHVSDKSVTSALVQACVDRVRDFNHQDAAISLWAVATMGVSDASAILALTNASVRLSNTFNPQDAANSIWAIATLGISDEKVISPLVNACVVRIKNFNSQDAGNSLWAIGSLGVSDEKIIADLARSCIVHIKGFKPQAVANSLWAIAKLRVSTEIVPAFAQACLGFVEKFNPLDASNALWSAAVLNITDPAFVRPLITKVSEHFRSITRVSDAQQCLQAHYFGFTLSIEAVLHFHAITQSKMDPMSTTNSQIHVSEALNRLGYATRLEVPIFNGVVTTDIVIEMPSSDGSGRLIKVSIEFDGPRHYLRPAMGSSYRVGPIDGQTLLRNTLLKRCGEFEGLVSIPFYEWDEIKGNFEVEAEYLKRKLSDGRI